MTDLVIPVIAEQHAQFTADADVNARGEFEVIAITAGQANGWNFTAKALKESVKLWDGTNSLIDHAGFFDMPSIMKLGGVCYAPTWDEARQGIKATLRPFGPCGPLVADLGREVLAAKAKGDPLPKIGFSADIWFKANGRDVIEITRITSLDLVIDPARGGDFLRALNQAGTPRREATMADIATPTPAPATAPAPAAPTLQTQITEDAAAVRALLGEQARQQALEDEAANAREVLLVAQQGGGISIPCPLCRGERRGATRVDRLQRPHERGLLPRRLRRRGGGLLRIPRLHARFPPPP